MQSRNQRGGGFLPLHQRGREQHFHQRQTSAQHVQHIAQGRAGGRGHNPNFMRELWNGTFTRRVEQSLRLQHGLQAHELGIERALARRAQNIHNELILPARFVQANFAMRLHRQAIGQRNPARALGVALPHHAAQRRARVFERKIQMPRSRARKVGNFALHPNVLKSLIAFQQTAHAAGELGYGQAVSLEKRHLVHGLIPGREDTFIGGKCQLIEKAKFRVQSQPKKGNRHETIMGCLAHEIHHQCR